MQKILAFFLSFASLFSLLFTGTPRVTFTVDAAKTGGTVGNIVGHVNVWDMGTQFYDAQNDPQNDVFEFVQYVQLMQCSGGTADRDLFRDPTDTTVPDDYDFTRLLKNCEGILRLGAKPFLKLGSVPLKYTADYVLGGFGMNVYPPDDYTLYYRYIYALADALVQEFGRQEVLTWRFGVMTEFENDDWFYARSKTSEDSCEAYCKLYDYTVQALVDAVGEDVFVGAHAMAVTQGLWDEADFIRHVAQGTNYATGEKGTRICYLSASFYDSKPGKFTKGKTLPETIGDLRKTAEKYGLKNLLYGVDEGRILSASAGAGDSQLFSRTVGHTWQAAYDARLWTQAIRSGMDYFSSWGYLSGGILSGYPTVSYHVAKLTNKMAGERQLETLSTTGLLRLLCGIEADGVASMDAETGTVHVMVYNFKNDLQYDRSVQVKLSMHLPQFAGKTVSVTQYIVSDECNYFDEWIEDRKTYGIGDDCFFWSPDDPCLDADTTLHDPAAKQIYTEQLREKYIECAKLVPTQQTQTVDADGMLVLCPTLQASNVLFLEIR
ncbi:MAG: hypothetical protein ACI4I5_10095 [Acutalibacteraceae bacterium]